MTAPVVDGAQRFRVTLLGRVLYTTDTAWRANAWAADYELAHPGSAVDVKPC